MLIDTKDLNGSTIAINTSKVIRLRKNYGHAEPKKSVTLDLKGKRIYVSDKLPDLVDRIREHEPLAELTTPVGTQIFVAADRVVDVRKPSDINDHPNAKAVVSLHVNQKTVVDQQVAETVAKARNAINDTQL